MKVRKYIFTLFYLLVGITPVVLTFLLHSRTRIVPEVIAHQVNSPLFFIYLLFIIVATLYSIKIINVQWDHSLVLLAGMFLLYTGPLLAQYYSTVPGVHAKLLLVFSSSLLIYLYKDELGLNWIVNSTRYFLLFYIYGSILAAFIIPGVAVDFNYWQGWIPSFSIRLNGITNHANSLAPLIFLYAVLDYYYPKKNKLRFVHLPVAWICLLFTQSKSIIALLLIFYGAVLGVKIARKYIKTKKGFIILTVALVFSMIPIISKYVLNFIQSNNVLEFTGRNQIWGVTLQEWKENPMFGYGLQLWGQEMQAKYQEILGWAPGHAHSQFFQTLGESGYVGVIGLLLYTGILLYLAIRFAKATKGFTLVLFFFLLFRGITEPVFVNTTDNVAYFIHFMIITLFMAIITDSNRQKQTQILPPVEEPMKKIKIDLLALMIYVFAVAGIINAFLDYRGFALPILPFPFGRGLLILLGGVTGILSLWMIVQAFLSKEIKYSKPRMIIAGVSLLFIIAGILASFFGHRPELKEMIFVELILFFALYFVKDMDLSRFAEVVKKALLLTVYGSLIMAIIVPSWSFKTGYDQGLFDFFSIRLYGITTNANNTASLFLLYLLFEMQFPTKSKYRAANIGLTLVLLFLTQSKTVWALLLFFYLCKVVYTHWGKIRHSKWFKIAPIALAALLIVGLISQGSAIMNLFNSKQSNVFNFTGRTVIWELTIQEWQNNKTFGYGLNLWDEKMFGEYAEKIKFGWTFSHAHNQYVQSLGESGIVGLVALLIYLSVFLYFGIKYAKQTRGMSLIFALYPILRGWTEPVFRHYLLDTNLFIHLILYVYFLLLVRQKDFS